MTTNASTRLGELLRTFRLSAALSQEALAERAGLSVDAIRALERGRRSSPRPDTLGLLFEALDLSPADRQLLVEAANSPSTVKRNPPVTVTRARSSWAQALGPLIGRESEGAAVTRLLVERRLPIVSLIGPGGVGKTRLSLAMSTPCRTGSLTAPPSSTCRRCARLSLWRRPSLKHWVCVKQGKATRNISCSNSCSDGRCCSSSIISST